MDHPAVRNRLHGFFNAVHRQGQGKTDVALTAGAEAEARRADDSGFLDQLQAKG